MFILKHLFYTVHNWVIVLLGKMLIFYK